MTEPVPAPAPPDPIEHPELFAAIYQELRHIASGYMRRQRSSHTLQPTALVHEAFLRVGGLQGIQSVEHFKAAVAKTMKRILIDHARGKTRRKRTSGGFQVSLADIVVEFENHAVDLIDLDEALAAYRALGENGALGAEIVELRFFGALSMEEVSFYLKRPLRTVERNLRIARLWLHDRLGLPTESTDRA